MDISDYALVVMGCCVALIGLQPFLGVRLGAVILGVGFLAEQFLVDLDFGPASLRVYIYGALLLWVVARFMVGRERGGKGNGLVARLILVYAAAIVWQTFLQLAREGNWLQVTERLLAGPCIAVAVIVLGQALVRRPQEVKLMMVLFAGATLLSGLFAVLQWLGVDWAWTIARELRSGTDSQLVMEGMKGGRGLVSAAEAVTWTPGLSLFSVTLCVQLMAMGFIVYFWGITAGTQARMGRILGVVSGLLAYGAVFVSQQRSGIIILPILLLVCTNVWGETSRQAARRDLRMIIVGAGTLAVVAVVLYGLSTVAGDARPEFGEGGYRLDRMNQVSMLRMEIARVALEVFAESPLTGDRDLFMIRTWRELGFASTPHNLFLTSMALYGLPGLLLTILLCSEMWRFGRTLLKRCREYPELRWIGYSIVFGLLAHTANAQLHNPSLLTGDILPAWLLGVGAGLMAGVDKRAELREKSDMERLKTETASMR